MLESAVKFFILWGLLFIVLIQGYLDLFSRNNKAKRYFWENTGSNSHKNDFIFIFFILLTGSFAFSLVYILRAV